VQAEAQCEYEMDLGCEVEACLNQKIGLVKEKILLMYFRFLISWVYSKIDA
jgi:hypothetical protein